MKMLKFFIENLGYILIAYVKYTYDLFRGYINERTVYRRSICSQCEFSKLGICLKCGCVIAVKTNIDYIEDDDGKSIGGCPLSKW